MMGAKVSTSGHMTSTSRGSRVGSSASRPRITSRSTSTWRVRPWQACTWTLRSLSSSGGGCGWTRSCGEVLLEPAEEGVRGRCVVVVQDRGRVGGAAGEELLELEDVSGQRRQQGIVELAAGNVVVAAGHMLGLADRLPERGRGVVQPQVHVAVLGERGQDAQARRGQAAGAEDGESFGEPAQVGVGAESRAGVVEQLGGGRLADPVAQPAPKLRLPPQIVVERRAVTALVPAIGPGAQHLRPRLPILVEQVRQPSGHGQASSLVLVARAEVLGERPAPRLVRDGLVDDLEERPEGLLRSPLLDCLGVLLRHGLQRLVEHRARPRELHVGADTVTVRCAEHVGEPLRQPPLDALGRHGDDLAGERVSWRRG